MQGLSQLSVCKTCMYAELSIYKAWLYARLVCTQCLAVCKACLYARLICMQGLSIRKAWLYLKLNWQYVRLGYLQGLAVCMGWRLGSMHGLEAPTHAYCQASQTMHTLEACLYANMSTCHVPYGERRYRKNQDIATLYICSIWSRVLNAGNVILMCWFTYSRVCMVSSECKVNEISLYVKHYICRRLYIRVLYGLATKVTCIAILPSAKVIICTV
jgi:hypothetical protein